MSTIIVPRSDVTVKEVSAVLRSELGSHYKVTPFASSHVHHESVGHEDAILVRRNWFVQANVRVVPGTNDTEIHVGSGGNFTPTGLVLNRATIVRKVHEALERSTELTRS